ncbi:MAG: DUF1343 domain-containing protein [Deltaproteobacteria bacterium]|nr:DUF1343 domain-containing protein [Deltaproteobacteria bacterium]
MSVVPGIEVLCHESPELVRGRKVALLAHAASVDRAFVQSWDLLRSAGARLVRVLSPEHGLWAEAQDMEAVQGGTVMVGGREVPLTSLYGADASSLAPGGGDLDDIELLVVDLGDVGARYYTFAATADMAAAACLERSIEVVVADRPNPLGGLVHEGGASIERRLRSFVGHFEVPARHGLTLGELVRSSAGRAGRADGLRIIEAKGWSRSADGSSSAPSWIPPSPNMPTLETAWVYPGACLVEGTDLSEGRGTTRPFETVGAPYLDGEAVASLLTALPLEGASFRPLRFRPLFQKHAGVTCSGLFVHVTDRAAFRPLRTYAALLWAARRVAGERMHWRRDAYEFRSDVPAIDLLWGSPDLRQAIDSGAPARDILAMPDEAEREWEERRSALRLY